MRKLLKGWLSTPPRSRDNTRWPTWLVSPPDPRPWALRRHSVALGAGIGALVSVIPLPIQIPAAVLAAVWLRAHVATAAAATLLSNPLTIVPMWAAAWKIGVLIADTPDHAQAWQSALSFDHGWFDLASVLDAVSLLGPPLLIGLPVLGTVLGLAAYGAVMVGWRFAALWRRKRHLAAARRP